MRRAECAVAARRSSWPLRAAALLAAAIAVCGCQSKTEDANARFRALYTELGSVPLPVLAGRVDRFIAEGGKGPYPDME